MKEKGWIALDIDGTLTENLYSIPEEVFSYLKELHHLGWGIIFLTGRAFSVAYSSLKPLDIPYYLCVQNGALLLEMPKKEVLFRNYLNLDTLKALETVYPKEKDFVVYAGLEKGDFCYYRKERFSKTILDYYEKLKTFSPLPWVPFKNIEEIGKDGIPLIKCIGAKEAMEHVNHALIALPDVSSTLIRDRIDENLYLNLVTHATATKGNALENFLKTHRKGGPVIAAGDDLNDVTMLKAADLRIVINTAPIEMHSLAHIVAERPQNLGIISALKEATQC